MSITKKIIVLGGGGHARVVLDSILSAGLYNVEGIVDPNLKPGGKVNGFPVFGGDEYLDKLAGGDVMLALGIGSLRADSRRKDIYEKFKKRFDFPPIVHKAAYISINAEYKEGAQIMAGAVIQPNARIGENSIINTAAVIEHDCMIGSHCHISVGAILGGGVEVGDLSHVGMGAKILQGVKIGAGSTIGAGAVVTKDVGDSKTVCGVPAREASG